MAIGDALSEKYLTPVASPDKLVTDSKPEDTNAIVTSEFYIGEYADWNLSDVKSAGHCSDPDCERCLPDTREWDSDEGM